MNTKQLGLGTLALSGLLFAVGYVLAGPFVLALGDLGMFSDLMGSAGFRYGILANILGIILELFGFLGLYAYTRHGLGGRSLLALVLSYLGIGFTLTATGMLPFGFANLAATELAPAETAFALANQIFNDPLFTAALALGGLLVTVGAVIFGIGLMRRSEFPALPAVLFIIASFLLSFAPAIPVDPLIWPLDMTGSFLLLIAGVWLWRASGATTSTEG